MVAAHDDTPTANGQEASSAPPNIVMVVVDDAGWDDIGYHNDDFHTPTVDNLAKEGVKLEGMYTDRQCTPARSQLMTGRYNIHTGMQDNMIYALEPRGLGLQYETLPQKLENVGYDTIGIGKWHLGHYQENFCPWKRGFGQYFGNLLSGGNQETYTQKSEEWFPRVNGAFNGYAGSYEGYYLVEGGPDGFVAVGDKYDGIHSTELYTVKALEYLDTYAPSDKPFFLYIAYQAVHSPLMISKDWLATSKCDQHGYDEEREMLCAMMTQVDYWQSTLVDHLKESGTWHNTLYVFLSDNGANPGYGGSNYPLRGEKGQYWDGGVKSPVFMAGGYTMRALREAAAGHSAHLNTDLMHITDLPATVLSLAGVPIDDLDGVNQWEAITTNNATEVRNEVVININSEMYGLAGAIRVGKFKYIKTPEPEEDTLFWLLIKEMTEEPITKETNMLHMFKELQAQISELRTDDNSTYLFDMELNPNERTDGKCAVFSECNNLMAHDDYLAVKAMMKERYFYHLGTMVPSSVAFKYDGPLANPDFFNGSLGVPWRDENDLPYVLDDLSSFIPAAAKSSAYSLSGDGATDDEVAAATANALASSAKGFTTATGETVALLDSTGEMDAAASARMSASQEAAAVFERAASSGWASLAGFVALNVLVSFGTVMLTQRYRGSAVYSPI